MTDNQIALLALSYIFSCISMGLSIWIGFQVIKIVDKKIKKLKEVKEDHV